MFFTFYLILRERRGVGIHFAGLQYSVGGRAPLWALLLRLDSSLGFLLSAKKKKKILKAIFLVYFLLFLNDRQSDKST